MATNKRKDSAALFELIDKSTLKVPKNSGALKIPSWWSSKTNPPTTPAAGAAGAPVPVKPAKVPPTAPRSTVGEAAASPRAAAAAAVSPAAPISPVGPVAPVSSVDASPVPAEVPAMEDGEETDPLAPTPLFNDAGLRKLTTTASEESVGADLGPAKGAGGVSGATAGARAAGAAVGAGAVPAGSTSQDAPSFRAPTRATPISSPVAAVPRPAPAAHKGVFAPATHGVEGSGPGVRNPGGLSTMWLVCIGCAVLGVVLLSIYLMHLNQDKGQTTTTQPETTFGTATQYDSSKWTPVNATRPNNGVAGGLGTVATRSGPSLTQDGTHAARVWMAADVQWNKDLYYVVIATYPAARLDLARAAGEFIAKRGIDVVINNNNNVKALVLISYEGFPSNKAAEPLRNQIIEIGKEHPDARKQGGRSVWPTAYVWSGAKLVGAPK